MGCGDHNIFSHRLIQFTIYFLFLMISSSLQQRFIVEGRTIPKPVGHSQEEKLILRARIGSRPPRCERRCSSCGHCEAIQVPTSPQVKTRNNYSSSSSSPSSMSKIVFSIGDESYSNYKPMSWKCKCGNSIFNP